jgi:ABC-2 type transport system ATP-binding protein
LLRPESTLGSLPERALGLEERLNAQEVALMPAAIQINGLTKKFTQRGEVVAVDNLTLEVQEGEIFGFLGPNGAGKTTTIKMLLGLIFPTSGTATVLGRPAGDIEMKRQVSYLPESPYFYDHLTGGELLDFYARLFKLPKDVRERRVDELMELVGLKNDKLKQLKQYSKGMLQRIGIAQALVNDPKLLIFDEPTSGLDPVAHIEIRNLIVSLREQGKTVFLSSHQLSDVELVCDRVAILNYGRLVRTGRVLDLIEGSRTEIIAEGVSAGGVEQIRQIATDVAQQDGVLTAYHEHVDDVNRIVDAVRANGGKLISVVPQRRRLEDIFVETIGLEGGRRIGSFNELSTGGKA